MGQAPSEFSRTPTMEMREVGETPTERWAGRIEAYLSNPQTAPELPQVSFLGTHADQFLKNIEEILRKKNPQATIIVGEGKLTYLNLTVVTTQSVGSKPGYIQISGKIQPR